MNELILGQKTKGTAYFCPKCTNAVEISTHLGLVGTQVPVHCGGCGWDGDQSELAQASFSHEFKSPEEISKAMVTDLRNVLAKSSAVVYGRFLLKWGFMGEPIRSAELGRYLMNIANATVQAIIQTRAELMREATSGTGKRV